MSAGQFAQLLALVCRGVVLGLSGLALIAAGAVLLMGLSGILR